MKMRRWIALLLAIVMMMSLCLSAEAAVSTSTASVTAKNGRFYYADGETTDYSALYYYKDSYFKNSASVFNQSLATMSLSLAMSAFASNRKGYSEQYMNAKNLLTECGFINIQYNDAYTQKPTRDSIGVIVGEKTIQVGSTSYTLIALAIRGAGYEKEWASNFTIGSSGEHAGFKDAREKALSFLKSYVKSQNITGNVKLWITGYSRAAATANLLAGKLDQNLTTALPGISLKRNNIYAYCFECPAGALESQSPHSSTYNNIFNIINSTDLVTKVAPADMGFGRYGVDKFLPTKESTSNYSTYQKAMLSRLTLLGRADKTYTVDNFTMWKFELSLRNRRIGFYEQPNDTTGQGAFLDTVFRKLVQEQFKSRSNYTKNFQQGITDLCATFFGADSAQWQKVKELFIQNLEDNLSDLILKAIFSSNAEEDSGLIEMIANCFLDAQRKYNLSTITAAEAKAFAKAVVKVLIGFIVNHPNLTMTLIANVSGVAGAHQPTLCLAWMQSFDSNYVSGASTGYSNGSYRILRIGTSTDLSVYNSKGTLVAQVNRMTPKVISGGICTEISNDDEILVYVPSDQIYSVQMRDTTNGTISYGIKEFDASVGKITRIVNYKDVKPNQKGEIAFPLNAVTSTATRSTSLKQKPAKTDYSLMIEGKSISATQDVSGSSAGAAFYMVTLKVNHSKGGVVTGEGVRDLGDNAKVIATAADGYRFDGWYKGSTCVSKNASYTFMVEQDVTLEAKFSEVVDYIEPFKDVKETAWYAKAVEFVTSNGLFSGTAPDAFSPDAPMTRAMLVTVLYRHNGSPSASGSNPFTDVKSGAWYYDAVLWASTKGIVGGVGGGKFAPDDPVTREQLAVILYRYTVYRKISVSYQTPDWSRFGDKNKVSSWAITAMQWATANGLINGVSRGGELLLDPQSSATRAQVAQVLMNYVKKFA